jgi:hypothetical protein
MMHVRIPKNEKILSYFSVEIEEAPLQPACSFTAIVAAFDTRRIYFYREESDLPSYLRCLHPGLSCVIFIQNWPGVLASKLLQLMGALTSLSKAS